MSEDKSPGSEDLFRRPDDFSGEMSKDPEAVVYRTRASWSFIFVEILLSCTITLVGSYVAYRFLNNTRIFGSFYSTFSHPVLFKFILFAPTVLMLMLRGKSIFKKMVTRWDISRRFIREKTFVGVDLIETADMSKVIDISMTDLIAVVNLKVITKDKTSPEIIMEYLPRKQAYEIFSFIAGHSINSIPEFLASRTYKGKKGFDGAPRRPIISDNDNDGE